MAVALGFFLTGIEIHEFQGILFISSNLGLLFLLLGDNPSLLYLALELSHHIL